MSPRGRTSSSDSQSDAQAVAETFRELAAKNGGSFARSSAFSDLLESVHFEHLVAAHIANENVRLFEDIQALLTTVMIAMGGGYNAERIKKRIKDYKRSEERQQEMVECLKKAAELGGLPPKFYIDLKRKHRPKGRIRDFAMGLQYPEERRRADETEEQWTVRINAVPDPNFFVGPVTKYIGKRGGSADSSGAMRGLVVRMIARHVPTSTTNRYAAIAYISNLAGVPVSRQKVRSIILKGHT